MTMRVLSVVNRAYRGTIEEQDDTVLWLMAMCRSAGTDLTVLLRGEAVSYAVAGQGSDDLQVGTTTTAGAPRIDEDVERLIERDVLVLAVSEDVEQCGLADRPLLAGQVTRAGLPTLFAEFDQIWNW